MSKALITTIFISLIIESVFSKYIVLNFRTNIDLNSLTEENYMSSTIEQQIYVDLKIGESKQTIPMTLKSMKYPTFKAINPKNAEIPYYIGYLYSEQQKWNEAEVYLKKAVSLNPQSEPLRHSQSSAY